MNCDLCMNPCEFLHCQSWCMRSSMHLHASYVMSSAVLSWSVLVWAYTGVFFLCAHSGIGFRNTFESKKTCPCPWWYSLLVNVQFYDHYFEWDLKAQIQELVQIRKRNFINAESKVTILLAESDMYVANIADRVILKLGPRYVFSF